jgi:hypothetical protein
MLSTPCSTLVGYDIMSGRSLLKSTSVEDYAHFLIACLFHDIGLVRGILKENGRQDTQLTQMEVK